MDVRESPNLDEPYVREVNRVLGRAIRDVAVPLVSPSINKQRKKNWEAFFAKYSQMNPNDKVLNLETLEVEDDPDNSSMDRLPLRWTKQASEVQYWVDTGKSPHISSTGLSQTPSISLFSSKGDPADSSQFSIKQPAANGARISKGVLRNKSISSASSINTIAYLLANGKTTTMKNNLFRPSQAIRRSNPINNSRVRRSRAARKSRVASDQVSRLLTTICENADSSKFVHGDHLDDACESNNIRTNDLSWKTENVKENLPSVKNKSDIGSFQTVDGIPAALVEKKSSSDTPFDSILERSSLVRRTRKLFTQTDSIVDVRSPIHNSLFRRSFIKCLSGHPALGTSSSSLSSSNVRKRRSVANSRKSRRLASSQTSVKQAILPEKTATDTENVQTSEKTTGSSGNPTVLDNNGIISNTAQHDDTSLQTPADCQNSMEDQSTSRRLRIPGNHKGSRSNVDDFAERKMQSDDSEHSSNAEIEQNMRHAARRILSSRKNLFADMESEHSAMSVRSLSSNDYSSSFFSQTTVGLEEWLKNSSTDLTGKKNTVVATENIGTSQDWEGNDVNTVQNSECCPISSNHFQKDLYTRKTRSSGRREERRISKLILPKSDELISNSKISSEMSLPIVERLRSRNENLTGRDGKSSDNQQGTKEIQNFDDAKSERLKSASEMLLTDDFGEPNGRSDSSDEDLFDEKAKSSHVRPRRVNKAIESTNLENLENLNERNLNRRKSSKQVALEKGSEKIDITPCTIGILGVEGSNEVSGVSLGCKNRDKTAKTRLHHSTEIFGPLSEKDGPLNTLTDVDSQLQVNQIPLRKLPTRSSFQKKELTEETISKEIENTTKRNSLRLVVEPKDCLTTAISPNKNTKSQLSTTKAAKKNESKKRKSSEMSTASASLKEHSKRNASTDSRTNIVHLKDVRIVLTRVELHGNSPEVNEKMMADATTKSTNTFDKRIFPLPSSHEESSSDAVILPRLLRSSDKSLRRQKTEGDSSQNNEMTGEENLALSTASTSQTQRTKLNMPKQSKVNIANAQNTRNVANRAESDKNSSRGNHQTIAEASTNNEKTSDKRIFILPSSEEESSSDDVILSRLLRSSNKSLGRQETEGDSSQNNEMIVEEMLASPTASTSQTRQTKSSTPKQSNINIVNTKDIIVLNRVKSDKNSNRGNQQTIAEASTSRKRNFDQRILFFTSSDVESSSDNIISPRRTRLSGKVSKRQTSEVDSLQNDGIKAERNVISPKASTSQMQGIKPSKSQQSTLKIVNSEDNRITANQANLQKNLVLRTQQTVVEASTSGRKLFDRRILFPSSSDEESSSNVIFTPKLARTSDKVSQSQPTKNNGSRTNEMTVEENFALAEASTSKTEQIHSNIVLQSNVNVIPTKNIDATYVNKQLTDEIVLTDKKSKKHVKSRARKKKSLTKHHLIEKSSSDDSESDQGKSLSKDKIREKSSSISYSRVPFKKRIFDIESFNDNEDSFLKSLDTITSISRTNADRQSKSHSSLNNASRSLSEKERARYLKNWRRNQNIVFKTED